MLGAQRDQEMREVLDVRLGRGIAQVGDAVGRDRGDQRVLGGGDAGLVEEHVGAAELRAAELQTVGGDDGRAELLEGQEMGVEAPPADDVAARRRQRDLAAAGQKRTREQDRGADADAQLRIEIGGANGLGVDREPVAPAPLGRGADRADQFHQGLGVANARDVVERDRMLGQKGGRDDRQRGVLVAGRLDRALQAVAAFDDVLDRRRAVRGAIAKFTIHVGSP